MNKRLVFFALMFFSLSFGMSSSAFAQRGSGESKCEKNDHKAERPPKEKESPPPKEKDCTAHHLVGIKCP